jgi:16S rRNA (guanine966-N2)-methyltransferase
MACKSGPDESMRIIGGEWRSRRLVRPKTDATRPMPDRVKQAIFDMLASHYGTPGAIPSLLVADVFAGSGSMGLEALSRGARGCFFFERDRAALLALRENITALGADATTVVTGDAWRASSATPAGERFELVFLDPPYRYAEDVTPRGPVRLFLRGWAASDARLLVVFHHPANVRFRLDADEPWTEVAHREFGTSGVTFWSR